MTTAVPRDLQPAARGAAGSANVRELWEQLSATMRSLRQRAEYPLRRVETESGVGRGTLSQVETGKARPNRFVVEWYDTTFGGDGVLLALFAEARGAHGSARPAAPAPQAFAPDDALLVVAHDPPRGQLVACGSTVRLTWTVRNTGSVPWRDRRVARLGARAGIRLLTSNATDPLPDCDPGTEVTVALDVGVPSAAATYAAFWQVVDASGTPVLPVDVALSVELVGRMRD